MSQTQTAVYKPESNKIEGAASGSFFVTPATDIWHDREGYTLEVEVPGVDRNGLEISVEDGKLMVIGYRRLDRPPMGGEGPLRREERENRDYRRVFDLPPEVNASGIKANLEEGLLTLRIPKSESIQPLRIAVG